MKQYNPCGIATGGGAKFRVEVEPASIPDTRIVWSVAQGGVSFVGGNNKGRTVMISGGVAEADFRLMVDVTDGNLTRKPFFTGRMLIPKMIPVTVWIVRKDNGSEPSCTENRVQALLDEVNTLYQQSAMTFYVNGAIQYTNSTALWEINFTNGWSGELELLRNIEKETGGIELYFINQFIFDNSNENLILGIEDSNGIVLRSGVSGQTLAHEIGHACGLLDIYPYRKIGDTIDMTVSGPVSEERLPQDWGGGYYPPGMQHAGLIIENLLMAGYEDPTVTTTCDIPLGSVYGTWFEHTPPLFEGDMGIDIWSQSPAPVGLDSMGNRQPCHQ